MAKSFQVAALPIRKRRDGTTSVLLVTSRDTGRWVVPKGWRWAGHSDFEAAAREAWEEAGVVGAIGQKPIGRFKYRKRLATGSSPLDVTVFLLTVERAARTWPEQNERTRRWFRPEEAAELVEEPKLKDLIRSIAA